MPSLSHVTAVSSNPINLKRFVVSGFDHIQVSGDDFFDEPDTMCIAFCSCCEHGEQAWNMVRLMCSQPNIATRDRQEADSVTCLHSRVRLGFEFPTSKTHCTGFEFPTSKTHCTLHNIAPVKFCFLLEIWCICPSSKSRMASWKPIYRFV